MNRRVNERSRGEKAICARGIARGSSTARAIAPGNITMNVIARYIARARARNLHIPAVCAISYSRDALISYTLLNYSHLRRQAEFMNGKAQARGARYTSMRGDTARVRKFTEEKVTDDDDITGHHGHGLCRFWIRRASDRTDRGTFRDL